jgi:hypothetical protein
MSNFPNQLVQWINTPQIKIQQTSFYLQLKKEIEKQTKKPVKSLYA